MMKHKKYLILLLVFLTVWVLPRVYSHFREPEKGLIHDYYIGTITAYENTENGAVIVLSDILGAIAEEDKVKKFAVTDNTWYGDDQIKQVVLDRQINIVVRIDSEFLTNTEYDVYPISSIGLDQYP